MYGKNNNITVKIDLRMYDKSYHVTHQCKGRFEVGLMKDYIYTESVLGPIKLAVAPVVLCKTCAAEYLSPQFSEWLEREISKRLILSKGLLTKKQIKFLRLDFGFTQEELGKKIELRKEQLAKMESEKYSEHMSSDKQFVLKFHLAKILGIKDLSTLHPDSGDTEVKTSMLVPSKIEIEKVFKLKKAA